MIRTMCLGAALFSTCAAWSVEDRACAGLEIPGKHFVYVAGADLKRIKTPSLELGQLELPQKRDIDFLVVVSPDLMADIQGGGRDVAGELHPAGITCTRAKVYKLGLQFGSVLPPGSFSIPFPIFSRKADGQPALEAAQRFVSGTISRIWLNASLTGADKLVLRNNGNRATAKMSFSEPSPSLINISKNRCEGATLQPGDSCEISFKLDRSASSATMDWKVDYADSNEYLDMMFSIEPKGVSIVAFNKFYE